MNSEQQDALDRAFPGRQQLNVSLYDAWSPFGSLYNGMAGMQNMGMLGAANQLGAAQMQDPTAYQRDLGELWRYMNEATKCRERAQLARIDLVDDVAAQTPHLLDYCL